MASKIPFSVQKVFFQSNSVIGLVEVQNCTNTKSVIIHYTFDNWKTTQSADGMLEGKNKSDDIGTFRFEIPLNESLINS